MLAVALAVLAVAAPPRVERIATIVVPAHATDLSGLTDLIAGDVPHSRLGGFGSAIEYTGKDHTYLILPDRGPRDGGTAYQCRFHLATIAPASDNPARWEFTLSRTVLLKDEQGRPFIGSSGAYRPSGNPDGRDDLRLDPEGVRIAPDGTIFISDEYGPHVLAFSPEGALLRRLPVPARYNPAVRDGLEEGELPPRNPKGRQPNRGFEGLALSPDGTTLLAFPQSPLIQDGGLDEANERIGRFIRVLHLPVSGHADPVEWVYPMKSAQFGTNELLHWSGQTYLAIERDNKEGDKAKAKRVIAADFSRATNVADRAELPSLKLPADIVPADVSTLIDLIDPAFGLNTPAAPMPAKVEGLAAGPKLPDGRRVLIVTTDNDFKPDEPSYLWIFAVRE